MKWISFQINRFILPTNYTVNKYNKNQDPGCSFCNTHLERLPTLLWVCPVVREFWLMVENIITFYFPQFKMGRKEAIFGDTNSKGSSVINTMLFLSKQFVWNSKFGSKKLDEVSFILFMKKELSLLLDVNLYKNRLPAFSMEWLPILEHFEI